jgi:uncharacterized RDD family membrane protein YckC
LDWYYAVDKQRMGPVDETEFELLVSTGKITQDTLIWKAGMDSWLAYKEVFEPSSGNMGPAPSDATVPAGFGLGNQGVDPAFKVDKEQQAQKYAAMTPGTTDVNPETWSAKKESGLELSDEVAEQTATQQPEQTYQTHLKDDQAWTTQCAQCRLMYPASEMVAYQNLMICSNCKPVFFQRLREGGGAAAYGFGGYAGFWIRAAAYLIDYIIMFIVSLVFQIPMAIINQGMGMNGGGSESGAALGLFIFLNILVSLLALGANVAYHTYFLGKYEATPGKMIVGIKVVVSDGSKITYLRAFGRFWAKILSGLILAIGYIMAGFDDQKRALHDYICDTRVIYK